jgi:hypothetical protein
MTIRTRNTLVVFHHPFEVYRRVSTVIFAPGQSRHGSSVEMLTIDQCDLQAAKDRDSVVPPRLPL